MKLKVTTVEEVDIALEYPCYFKSSIGSHFALFKDDKKLLCVFTLKGMASIVEQNVSDASLDMFMVKGQQITSEDFAMALMKATSIFETYFTKDLISIFPPPIEELENSLYELAE